MNSVLKESANRIFACVNFIKTQFLPVRYRYYADKIAKGPYSKKFGYNDKIFQGGLLPRLKDAKPLPRPIYTPKNCWSKERALFGQNDYIDLLGGGKISPPDISYGVPKWLRGYKGNEMRLLLLKQKTFKHTLYEYENPTAWFNMSRRVKYLYRFLNRKTKTNFSKKE